MGYKIPPRGAQIASTRQEVHERLEFLEHVAETLDVTVRDLIREIETGDLERVSNLMMAYRDHLIEPRCAILSGDIPEEDLEWGPNVGPISYMEFPSVPGTALT